MRVWVDEDVALMRVLVDGNVGWDCWLMWVLLGVRVD